MKRYALLLNLLVVFGLVLTACAPAAAPSAATSRAVMVTRPFDEDDTLKPSSMSTKRAPTMRASSGVMRNSSKPRVDSIALISLRMTLNYWR